MKLNKLYIIFILIVLFSCKKKEEKFNLHEDYSPTIKGLFIEYNVTSIYHDHNSGIHDTTNFLLKTVIGDSLIDNVGEVAYKFNRYVFNNLYNEYKIKDVWTIKNLNYKLELVEENQRILKMVFAPTLKKEWDMNAYNMKEPIYAYYENIHKPASFGNLNFDSTVTVIEEKNPPNIIEYRIKTETYAKNVGLIAKYYKDITLKNGDTLLPQRGVELFYTIKNFGIQ